MAEGLRLPIFNALNHLSSHRCGLEPTPYAHLLEGGSLHITMLLNTLIQILSYHDLAIL